MRLGQLARKHNINQEEVIRFLNEAQPDSGPFHHNTKLSDELEELVTNHFAPAPEPTEEVIAAPMKDSTAEENEQEVDGIEIVEDIRATEADLQRELDPTLPPVKTPRVEKKDERTIETDRLLELLEDEEASADLSKITHIKAPKKELSGLKVVGKIELAEPKNNSVEKEKKLDKEVSIEEQGRRERQRKKDEEKEKRRLRAKEKKEQFEARQEKRRIEKEKKQKKAQNKARYQQKMQQLKPSQPKQIIQKEATLPEVNEQPDKPRSFLGKIWQWLKA
jgi:hypothetical protein